MTVSWARIGVIINIVVLEDCGGNERRQICRKRKQCAIAIERRKVMYDTVFALYE